MEETCDEGGNELETALGETGAVVDERVISGSAQKTSEADAEGAEAQSSGGSYPNRMDDEQSDADHSSTLDALYVAEDAAAAADVLEGDSSEAPSAPVVHEGDHPHDRTDAERRVHCQKTYHMVVSQILQQQKHRPGRRFKKKTLIKMAKLFVIARGWDSEGSRGLNVAEMLNHKDLLASILSQTEPNAAEGGRGETLSPMTSNPTDSKETKKSRESRLPAEPDERDISSASAREEAKSTCEDRELPRNEAAGTSGVKTSKQRKRTAKTPEAGGKKRARRKPSTTNDVRQDGGLAPQNDPKPNPPENPRQPDQIEPKVGKKTGTRIRKETMIPTGVEPASGGKRRKKKKTVQSAETAAEAGGEAGGNVDSLSRITEDETRPLEVQKRRRKRTKPSVSQQAAQPLSARAVSLREQTETTQSPTAAPPTAATPTTAPPTAAPPTAAPPTTAPPTTALPTAPSPTAAPPTAAPPTAAPPTAAPPTTAPPTAPSPTTAPPSAASPVGPPSQTKPAVNGKKRRGNKTSASALLQVVHTLTTESLQEQTEATPSLPAASPGIVRHVVAPPLVAPPNQTKPGRDRKQRRRKRTTASASKQTADQLTTADVSLQEGSEATQSPAAASPTATTPENSPHQTKPAHNRKKCRRKRTTASGSLQVAHQLSLGGVLLQEQNDVTASPSAAPPTAAPPTAAPSTTEPPSAAPPTAAPPTTEPPTAAPPTTEPPTTEPPVTKKRRRKGATSSASLQAAHQLAAADEVSQPPGPAPPTESPHQPEPADNAKTNKYSSIEMLRNLKTQDEGKVAGALNVPEEFHVLRSGPKQEEDEPIVNRGRKGRRRKKDGAAEESELLEGKSEPSWEAGTLPVMDVRRELVQHQTRVFRKRKGQKYVDGDASTQGYELTAGDGAEGALDTSISGRPKQKGKAEVHDTSLVRLRNTEVESSRYRELRARKVASGSNVATVPQESLTGHLEGSRKRSGMADVSDYPGDEQETAGIWTDDTPKPENPSKRKYERGGWTARGRKDLPADVEASVGPPGDQENAPGNMKGKRKRAKRKTGLEPAGPVLGEAVRCPPDPPDSSASSNLPREARRRGRPKREQKNSTSGGQTGSTPEIPNTGISAVAGSRRGRRWLRRGAKPSVDATAPMEAVTSHPKDVPEVAVELHRRTSTKTKETTSTAGENLRRDREAGAVGGREPREASNIRGGRRERDAVTMKTEGAAARLIHLKQTPEEFEASEVTCSLHNKSNSPESVPSAPPTKTTIKRRRRRTRTHWVGQRKVQRRPIGSLCVETSPLDPSLCESTSAGETIGLRLGDWEQDTSFEARDRPGPALKSSKKNLQCRFCGRCFRHISAFTLHKRIHTGEKPFGCPACGKTFSKLLQLKRHSKVHGQPPTMHCPCCAGTFKSKAELILHFKTHLTSQTQTESKGRFCSRNEAFRCSVCLKESTRTDAFEKHRQSHGGERGKSFLTPSSLSCPQKTRPPLQPRSEKLHEPKPRSEVGPGPPPPSSGSAPSHARQTTAARAGRTAKDASAAPRAGETTAVVLKCPICKEQHHHWCNYVQHLQIHRCKACRRGGGPAAQGGERRGAAREKRAVGGPVPRPSSPSDTSAASLSSGGPAQQTPKLFGERRTARKQPRLRRRLRGRAGTPFCCSQCELEFRFWGSYVDHLQEHAAQTSADPQPSGRHRRQDRLKCSTCGRGFSSPANLQRHQLLHRGAKSHVCLPCGLAFSCHAALTSHLETHRKRISAPLPAPVSEPLLFPFHCRKCTAEFSSAELLQAHRVCHFTAGKQPGSPPGGAPSWGPRAAPAGVREGAPETPQRPPPLPVSNKKHLFRYPHPDRLYVVPIVSSEPPVVVSDTEEGDLNMAAPAGDPPDCPPRTPGVGVNPDGPGAPRFSNHRGLQLRRLVQSLLPQRCSNVTDSSDGEDETPKDGVHACTLCSTRFADVSQLHTHYVDHARGV